MNNDQIQTIKPQQSLFSFRLKEIWQYRDLLQLFIRREIIVKYKQTILGPAWYFIQPLLQTIMFTVVFGNIAGIPTDGVPKILFYLAGVTAWNYFAECLRTTSDTFVVNYALFQKIYFPRAVMPMAIVLSNILKFLIQLLLFLAVYLYFIIKGANIVPNYTFFLTPVYVLITAGLALGFGLSISAMTSKYRDLKFLIQFGVQLWMYATPIIYPISQVGEKYHFWIMLNPMTSVVEAFKYAFLGVGDFSVTGLVYSSVFMFSILTLGMMVFNKVEKNVIDTA